MILHGNRPIHFKHLLQLVDTVLRQLCCVVKRFAFKSRLCGKFQRRDTFGIHQFCTSYEYLHGVGFN